MSNTPTYWTTKDGRKISVDDMEISHLRNAFKLLIKRHESVLKQANDIIDSYNSLVRKYNAANNSAKNRIFSLNGDIANMFNDDMEYNEFNDFMED